MLHFRSAGLSREQLAELLFEDREIQNVSHSLQVLRYNLKKKLREAGLPDAEYITNRRGVFCWTKEIPVEEDAETFERLCDRAESCGEKEEKLRLCLQACELYTGEFLGERRDQILVAQEARRYEERFGLCVHSAAELLRERRGWARLELLGRHAARVQPFVGWERLCMEAMLAMGRAEEAKALYRSVERYYRTERDLSPDRGLVELLERADGKEHYPVYELGRIQQQLSGQKAREEGGYLCSLPEFERIYRRTERQVGSDGVTAMLVGFSLREPQNGPAARSTPDGETTARFERLLRGALRQSDTLTRYGEGEFLVLLVNASRDECRRICRSVEEAFRAQSEQLRVAFYLRSVGTEW